MMRGTFFGLEIGRTGLSTAQFGLDVTGHNIANLDTEGYTRQRIVSTANDPFAAIGRFAPTGQGQVGGGVRVKILDQIRSSFLDNRFRTESTANAYWETRTQSLTYIQSFFDNVNEATSINHSMAQFFESMMIVSQDPVSGAPRTLMQTTAMDLVQQLNMIYSGLVDLQAVENKAVETKTGDINRIAMDIAELNKAIYRFELTGMLANDLKDKRNLLLDDLARLVDVDYEEYDDSGHSKMRVTIGGNILVEHDSYNELTVYMVDNKIPGESEVAMPVWASKLPTPLNRDEFYDDDDVFDSDAYEEALEEYQEAVEAALLDMSKISGGELKAHMDMRDGVGGGVDSTKRGIPYYIEMMNNLARALVQEINAQHVQGWTDHPEGSETGIRFFDDMGAGTVTFQYDDDGEIISAEYIMNPDEISKITAKNIRLSQYIIDSAFNIAVSDTKIGRAGVGGSEELQSGNNLNMRRLYNLFSSTNIGINITNADGIVERRDIGSFDDYGKVIRFDVGNTLSTAKLSVDTSRILTLAANNQRTAIAGVSLDEEMVNLVRYNHAYNGAARIITAMDDALDRLINGTGRVGL